MFVETKAERFGKLHRSDMYTPTHVTLIASNKNYLFIKNCVGMKSTTHVAPMELGIDSNLFFYRHAAPMELEISRSHVLTFSRSHALTLSRSHILTFSHSHILTFSHSHILTFSLSHALTKKGTLPNTGCLSITMFSSTTAS